MWGQEDKTGAFCGMPVSSLTWQREQIIKVKGVIDGIKDRNQERVVEVSVSINSTFSIFYANEELGRVQVCGGKEILKNLCNVFPSLCDGIFSIFF